MTKDLDEIIFKFNEIMLMDSFLNIFFRILFVFKPC